MGHLVNHDCLSGELYNAHGPTWQPPALSTLLHSPQLPLLMPSEPLCGLAPCCWGCVLLQAWGRGGGTERDRPFPSHAKIRKINVCAAKAGWSCRRSLHATNFPVPFKFCKDTQGEEDMGFKQGPALGHDFRDLEGLKHQREGLCFLQWTSGKRKVRSTRMGKSQGMQLRWVKMVGFLPPNLPSWLYNTANLSHSQGNWPPSPRWEKVCHPSMALRKGGVQWVTLRINYMETTWRKPCIKFHSCHLLSAQRVPAL